MKIAESYRADQLPFRYVFSHKSAQTLLLVAGKLKTSMMGFNETAIYFGFLFFHLLPYKCGFMKTFYLIICHRDFILNHSSHVKNKMSFNSCLLKYSEISLLRPPKIKTFYLLKTFFAKFKFFFFFFFLFSIPSVFLIRDHLWDCPKVVFKTTFGQS